MHSLMNVMKRRIVITGLVVLLTNGVAQAQQSSKTASPESPGPTSDSKTTQEDSKVLRKKSLQIFQEFTLVRTLDSIKKMDAAALRISARNQILRYLSGDKESSGENKTLATKVVLDALSDFADHSDEISPFMANYLLGDLGAWIEKYEPKLDEKFQEAIKKKKSTTEAGRIQALFGMKGGDSLAASPDYS